MTTAKEVREKLKNIYDDSCLTRRCGLLRKLTIHLANCSSISEHVDLIISTAQELNEIGMSVGDESVGNLLVSGLSEHFSPDHDRKQWNHGDRKQWNYDNSRLNKG